MHSTDIAIIGAGAAGLMAAIQAGRNAPGARIVALDGAAKLGSKILVAGGGRCNVTHESVSASDYAGSTPGAIGKVLRHFTVDDTVRFFAEQGVPLKREETGKLFPVSNRARTVLDALVAAAQEAGVSLLHPRRVEQLELLDGGFRLSGPWGSLTTRRVILATGGKSLPKSGSDGGGYALAQRMGHTLTPRIFPALVPLLLPAHHFLRELSGISFDCVLTVTSGTGKRLHSMAGAALCTHFGLSGPAALDVSRHWLDARADDPNTALLMSVLPDESPEHLDAVLRELGRTTPLNALSRRLPDRLARAFVVEAGIEPSLSASQLTREARRGLVTTLTALRLPIAGDRGYTYAEVTAGGVPLSEFHLDTMESRVCPGLHLCGEICDVDGRIGGFNFQWAWASGATAGTAAGRAVSASADR
ncbi:MAG: aminoacetone oxidase family FAD-binding enzyme [Anaerolineae bacterium]